MDSLGKLSELLDNYEFKEGDEMLKAWFQDLSSKETGLIKHILNTLATENTMLKMLYQIQVRSVESVSKQVRKSSFWVALFNSILTSADLPDVYSVSIFIMTFPYAKNKNLSQIAYNTLMTSLSELTSEITLNICLDILNDYFKKYQSEFLTHKQATLTIQLLLSKLNRSEGYTRVKALDTFSIILKEKIELCYTTDLMVLCDILLSVLENNNKAAYPSALLVLESLYFDKDFSDLHYRLDESLELLKMIHDDNFQVSRELINQLNKLNTNTYSL